MSLKLTHTCVVYVHYLDTMYVTLTLYLPRRDLVSCYTLAVVGAVGVDTGADTSAIVVANVQAMSTLIHIWRFEEIIGANLARKNFRDSSY